MLRSPSLPVEFFEKITFQNENGISLSDSVLESIKEIFEEENIKEAITIASNSLEKGVNRLVKEKNIKKKDQIVVNFMKYLIRMSTRPTPFGLFSSVEAGKISDDIKIQNKFQQNLKKYSRPDMDWLLSVINKIEKDRENVMYLKVKTNSLVDCSGERAYLAYKTRYGSEEETEMTSVSVRFTEAVNYVFELSKEPILYSELLENLYNKYPEENKEKISNFLWELFNTEYLISELRPPLTLKSPFNYLLSRLTKIEKFTDKKNELIKIKEMIENFDEKLLGEGREIYLNIIEKMKEIHQSSSYVQVDLISKENETSLSKEIVKEMAKVSECLWRLSPEYTTRPELRNYRNDFIEKYGIYREIPVLELLDPDRGLGAPAGYNLPQSRRQVEFSIPRAVTNMERFIQSEIVNEKFDKNKKEIKITDEIISKIEPLNPDYNTVPDSMELFFSIYAKTEKDIENGDYKLILGPNVGSEGAGKTFGRFIHFLDDSYRSKITKINEKEKELYDDVVFVELSYMPESGRSANICICENYRDYEVSICTNSSRNSEKTLPLSDILIGTTYDNFYIKSKSLNKRLIFKTSHMLNLIGAPNIYRFLREITTDGYRNWTQILRGNTADLPFVPRIVYEKTVLIPAVWNLSWESLDLEEDKAKNNLKLFIDKIKIWRKKWDIPKYVYLAESDNRILLDLESSIHLKVLLSETPKLNRYSALSLVEANIGEWAKKDDKIYNLEFVVPFIKNKNYKKINENQDDSIENLRQKNVKERIETNKSSLKVEDIRLKYPGSDWLFIKLYGNSKRENEFIAEPLKEFCEKIIEENIAEKYFFMRYVDPDSHIRLRFRGNPEVLIEKLIPLIFKESIKLKEEGLLSKMVIDTYDREVERYGGPELIDFAEDIFYQDSIIVSEILSLIRFNSLNFDFEKLVVVSIIDYLESFNLSFDEQLKFIESLVDRTEYLDDFRNDRKIYMKIANSNNEWKGLKSHEDGEIIREIFKKRHLIIKRFIQKFTMTKIKKRLYNDKNDIMASIIHLHCNRIIGIDRVYERKLMTLARHALYNLRYIKKQNQKLNN
jgi:thiopeptide-type bacteriocin biosynthesis protein